jgi:hypothetical protein
MSETCVCNRRGAGVFALASITAAFALTTGAQAGPPANDECAGAITILPNSTTIVTLDASATTNTAVVAGCMTGQNGGNGPTNGEIWFEWTQPAGETSALLRTCNTPAGLADDSNFGVYSGACGALVEVGCGEDDCGFSQWLSEDTIFGLVPGQVYKIQIGRWDDTTGYGDYTMELLVPAPTGACCFSDGSCEDLLLLDCEGGAGFFQGSGTNCDSTICYCPIDSSECATNQEGAFDPDCGLDAVDDDPDGGCNNTSEGFFPITCTSQVCGTFAWDGTTRDTDWFELDLTGAGGNTEVTMSVVAERNVTFGFIQGPGDGVCANITGFISPAATGTPCVAESVSICLPPGTWWFFVAPTISDNPAAFLCGDADTSYYATWSCGTPCDTAVGACCLSDGNCVEGADEFECIGLGGALVEDTLCADADCPAPCMFDSGPSRVVIFNGTPNSLLGYSAGNVSAALPNRRAVGGFDLPVVDPGSGEYQINEIVVEGFTSGSGPTTFDWYITIRNAATQNTTPPGIPPAGVILSGSAPGQNLTAWSTLVIEVDFKIAPGDYWLTVYSSHAAAGNQWNWGANCDNGVQLIDNTGPHASFMWRGGDVPATGYAVFDSAAVVQTAPFDDNDIYLYSMCLRGFYQPVVKVPCPFDCAPPPNGDGAVNVSDLLLLLAEYGAMGPHNCDDAPPPSGDGAVNVTDLLGLLAVYGATCP